jgi:hypothetical protein
LSLISGRSTYCWIVECHPFPITKIEYKDIIRSMEGFTFASVLDLNMGYYHIKLNADYWLLMLKSYVQLYTHAAIWKSKNTKRLPMRIKISWFLRLFKTSSLSLSKIWNMLRLTCYVDDLLILTNSSFKDHLLKLQMVLSRLSTNELLLWKWMILISKSKFFAEQIEYMRYLITRQGIQPTRNNVEMNTILIIKVPKPRKEKTASPYYWYSWLLSRHMVLQNWASSQVPLTSLTSSQVKFEWHSSHQ